MTCYKNENFQQGCQGSKKMQNTFDKKTADAHYKLMKHKLLVDLLTDYYIDKCSTAIDLHKKVEYNEVTIAHLLKMNQ